jgi:hypothetical protein
MPRLRLIRSELNSSSALSAKSKRETQKEETMGRRTLTLKDQLRGVSAALRSVRTPPQLRPGLKKRKEVLEQALSKRNR